MPENPGVYRLFTGCPDATGHLKRANGPWRRNPAAHAEGHLAMSVTITSDLVEAYSLCPRKAFLLMTGATTDLGPHDYELLIREQAEANRQAHRARLAKVSEVVPFSGPTDLTAGWDVLADAELATGILRARVDFLAKVGETSRLGRHAYETVKVIGTCEVSRTDTLGLAYQSLVLGEVQVTCSPKLEPGGMRVILAREGRRTPDEAYPPLARADHPQAP
jgi:hypothetical protein